MPTKTITADQLRSFFRGCSSVIWDSKLFIGNGSELDDVLVHGFANFEALAVLVTQHFAEPELTEAEFAELYHHLNIEIK